MLRTHVWYLGDIDGQDGDGHGECEASDDPGAVEHGGRGADVQQSVTEQQEQNHEESGGLAAQGVHEAAADERSEHLAQGEARDQPFLVDVELGEPGGVGILETRDGRRRPYVAFSGAVVDDVYCEKRSQWEREPIRANPLLPVNFLRPSKVVSLQTITLCTNTLMAWY